MAKGSKSASPSRDGVLQLCRGGATEIFAFSCLLPSDSVICTSTGKRESEIITCSESGILDDGALACTLEWSWGEILGSQAF